MNRRKLWFVCIPAFSLILLVLLFIPGLGEDSFLIDDKQLFGQAFLRNPWTWRSLKIIATPGSLPDFYPLRDLSVWIDWSWGQNLMVDTSVSKVQNLVWLIGSACLAYLILTEVTKNKLFSLTISCAWLLHPFHLESLHWISARKDLMSWFFIMLSALFVLKAQTRQSQHTSIFIGAACIAFVFSLLCKATFLAMPFAFGASVLCSYAWQGKVYSKKALTGLGISILLAFGFASLHYWNYTQNSYMQMSETPLVRFFSVMAALGRNVMGIVVPTYNGVDVEPWGGWYEFNKPFIPIGITAVIVFLVISVVVFLKKQSQWIFFISAAFAILIMTPGFNPNHRIYYSIRYFEPLFFVVLLWAGVVIAKTRYVMHVAYALLACFAVMSIRDAPSWQSNLEIFRKSYSISPKDASVRSMLLSSFYNVAAWGKLTVEENTEYIALYKEAVDDCIAKDHVNIRCLSFFASIKEHARVMNQTPSETSYILQKAHEKIIAAKKEVFSQVASAEIAGSVFQYKLNNGVIDKEQLAKYFSGHVYTNDDSTRIRYILLKCLELSPKYSQELYQRWLTQGIMQSTEMALFVGEVKDDTARKVVQNCFKAEFR